MNKSFPMLTMLAMLCVIPAMASAATLTGVITDDMCGKSHMMPGKSDADCIRACVKSGAKYAVMAEGKMYVLTGKTSEVDALAGKKVTVSGDLKGNTFSVASIAVAK